MNAADAAAIGARFGIRVHVETARELHGGYSNATWFAASDRGEIVVRRYGRLYVTSRAIAFEHAILTHASMTTGYVRAPYRTAGGETFVLHQGAYAACFPYVDGETGERNAPAARDAATMLASYHQSVRDVHLQTGMRAARSIGILAWLRERFFAVRRRSRARAGSRLGHPHRGLRGRDEPNRAGIS